MHMWQSRYDGLRRRRRCHRRRRRRGNGATTDVGGGVYAITTAATAAVAMTAAASSERSEYYMSPRCAATAVPPTPPPQLATAAHMQCSIMSSLYVASIYIVQELPCALSLACLAFYQYSLWCVLCFRRVVCGGSFGASLVMRP
jgi:hypothetical protein